jgi:glycerol dehydrogenase-like iron-containing ADH family enzyme
MTDMKETGYLFTTIYGRNLVGELRNFVHRPYLVVTMEDLWSKFEHYFDDPMADVYFVKTLDSEELRGEIKKAGDCSSIVGLGGGQALDIAKYLAWSLRRPLFQVPTSMTVNAAFGHRTAIRFDGKVRYIGWAVPEAVYIDFDVIQGAPRSLNCSGVGDILCYHTAHADWKLAYEQGKTEPQWPYDERLVAEARSVLDGVLDKLDDIRDVTDDGVRTLMNAHRWGGAAFHNAGWNPRHIEGVEHFLFYALEYLTGKHFIHGQPVCLGVYIGSAMQENRAEEMLAAIHRVGVDIRPEAMGLTWETVTQALYRLDEFTRTAGLWYTIANDFAVTEDFVRHVRQRVEDTFGPWEA